MTEFGWIIPIVKMYSGILQILMLYSFTPTHNPVGLPFTPLLHTLLTLRCMVLPSRQTSAPVTQSAGPALHLPVPRDVRCPHDACCPSQCRWCPMSARCPMFTRCRDGRCPQGVRVVRCPYDVPRDVCAVRAAAARDWAPRRGMGRAGAEAAPSLGHLPHTALN